MKNSTQREPAAQARLVHENHFLHDYLLGRLGHLNKPPTYQRIQSLLDHRNTNGIVFKGENPLDYVDSATGVEQVSSWPRMKEIHKELDGIKGDMILAANELHYGHAPNFANSTMPLKSVEKALLRLAGRQIENKIIVGRDGKDGQKIKHISFFTEKIPPLKSTRNKRPLQKDEEELPPEQPVRDRGRKGSSRKEDMRGQMPGIRIFFQETLVNENGEPLAGVYWKVTEKLQPTQRAQGLVPEEVAPYLNGKISPEEVAVVLLLRDAILSSKVSLCARGIDGDFSTRVQWYMDKALKSTTNALRITRKLSDNRGKEGSSQIRLSHYGSPSVRTGNVLRK